MDKVTQFALKHNEGRKELYLRPGITVIVSEKIKEGAKERVQKFEGLVIATKGTGVNRKITVRKIASGGIGVEKTFIVDSPNIVDITPVKLAKVRRSKLYYMRELTGKAARLKEKHISPKDYQALVDKFGFGPEVAAVEVATQEAPAQEDKATEEETTEAPEAEAAETTTEEVATEEVSEAVAEQTQEETTAEVAEEATEAAAEEASEEAVEEAAPEAKEKKEE